MLIDAVRFPRIFENLRQSLRAVSLDELWRRNETLSAQRRVRRVHLPLAKNATSSNPGKRLTDRAQPCRTTSLVFAFCI